MGTAFRALRRCRRRLKRETASGSSITSSISCILMAAHPRRLAAHRTQGRTRAACRGKTWARSNTATHFDDTTAAVVLRHACDMSLEGIVSSASTPLSQRPLRDVHQDQMRERAGIRGRRLFALARAATRDRARSSATTITASSFMPAVSAPAKRGPPRDPGNGCILWRRQAAVRSNSTRASSPPRRALGRAEDGYRIAFPRMDHGRPGASGGVQGRTRGQATTGRRSGAAGHDTMSRQALQVRPLRGPRPKPPRQ